MAEKTEAPTARRMIKARESGNVVKSHELNNAVSLLIGTWLLSLLAHSLVVSLEQMLTHTMALSVGPDFNTGALWNIGINDLITVGPWLGLFMFGMLAAGILVNLIQTGFLFSTAKLGLHLERINPLNRIGQMFSLNTLMELAKALVKLVIIGGVVYAFLKERMLDLLGLVHMDLTSAIGVWAGLAYNLMIRAAAAYAVLAIIDYAFQRWNWMRGLKMTKEEVKEDNKLTEGDPFIRGRIRQQQRKIARMRMMANVKKADVVITNPTHLAIALAYNAKSMKAPRVLAKGADFIAQQIVSLARDNGVPIMQNIPLAHSLFKTVAIDQEIPPDLYVAMAQVMAYVYRLRGKMAAPSAPAPNPPGQTSPAPTPAPASQEQVPAWQGQAFFSPATGMEDNE